MRRIRLGIIGAGLIWNKAHKHKLEELKHRYEIVAFAVNSTESRDKLAGEYPDAAVSRDVHDLLNRYDIDVVVVLTPLHLNAAMTMAALEADKHVLVEKPLGTSPDDVHRIRRLEEKSGKKAIVLEQYRYDDTLTVLKNVLNDGRVGETVSYDVRGARYAESGIQIAEEAVCQTNRIVTQPLVREGDP